MTRATRARLDASLLNARHVLLVVDVVKAVLVKLLLDSVHVNVGNGRVAIEDLGDLLQGGALGLRVDEVHPDELDKDPALFDY